MEIYENDKHKELQWQKHMEHMFKHGKCQHPKPMHVYPEPAKSHLSYTPRSTVIHKCSDEAGCCRHGQVCTEKESSHIKLYFKVK